MKSNLPFLPLEASRPREVEGFVGEEGDAREDEGAPPEDDAPGTKADEGGYEPGKGPKG
jgi:hypothetical protein